MVGVNISDEQLGSIADRTIQEADTNGDNSISFNEFIKVSSVAGGRRSPDSYTASVFCSFYKFVSSTSNYTTSSSTTEIHSFQLFPCFLRSWRRWTWNRRWASASCTKLHFPLNLEWSLDGPVDVRTRPPPACPQAAAAFTLTQSDQALGRAS